MQGIRERGRKVELTCESCGNHFSKPIYQIRSSSPGRFCSRRCQGAFLGSHYGYKNLVASHESIPIDLSLCRLAADIVYTYNVTARREYK